MRKKNIAKQERAQRGVTKKRNIQGTQTQVSHEKNSNEVVDPAEMTQEEELDCKLHVEHVFSDKYATTHTHTDLEGTACHVAEWTRTILRNCMRKTSK